ncbi:MAG: hypothetical protein O3C40_20350 [Planctomycetota bacterium]|nr:hypothetical protein [Planctomycetota bacterium]
MERISQLQVTRNAETRDGWSCFAAHRERVTQLLLDAASATAAKLCVLGAGNCNDLALDRLADAFAHIDLVDIDDEAITAGITRQPTVMGRVMARGGVDVTGVASLLSEWVPEVPAADEQIDVCLACAQQAVLPLTAGGYSVAASSCLLSQLIESISLTLGAEHPRFLDLLTCLRREHLRQLVDLTMPGGTVVLITDVVSSLTVPELATASTSELPMLVGRAIAERNFFTGVNPFVIKRMLETDVPFATQLTDVRLSNPWVWDLGPRLYAVCALTAKRV